jgi:DNA modification methylase
VYGRRRNTQVDNVGTSIEHLETTAVKGANGVQGQLLYRIGARDALAQMPSKTVQCVVTSPPYWLHRRYGGKPQEWADGWEGHLGLEQDPDDYVDHLIEILQAVKRVLATDGVVWLNIADTYMVHRYEPKTGVGGIQGRKVDSDDSYRDAVATGLRPTPRSVGLKYKSLAGIPWRLGLALLRDGWTVRNEIIWHRPDHLPSKARDRLLTGHETIFLLSKSRSYEFDREGAIEEAGLPSALRRDVWTFPTGRSRGKHHAVMPMSIIEPMIRMGCPMGGTVLDPFAGTASVGEVALKLGRSFIGIDVCEDYLPDAQERLQTAVKDVDSRRLRLSGEHVTPGAWVTEAHDTIHKVLGRDWRDTCVIWDPAAGEGALTSGYEFADLMLSTIEPEDVRALKQRQPQAFSFAFDFLNGNIARMPREVAQRLRTAARDGRRLVILMNPPFGTGATAGKEPGRPKAGIARTAARQEMHEQNLGRSRQQLYAQFMFRAAIVADKFGFDKTTVAVFTKATWVTGADFREFRSWWYERFRFESGLLFPGRNFATTTGKWPALFSIWSSAGGLGSSATPQGDLTVSVRKKKQRSETLIDLGLKTLYCADGRRAADWVREAGRELLSILAPRMTSGLEVVDRPGRLADGSIACLVNAGNTPAHSRSLVYWVSGAGGKSSVSVTPDGFRRCCALYAARKLVLRTWQNDGDEYLVPDVDAPGFSQWVDDAIVYTAVHRSNQCTAMRGVSWKGKEWRIRNNFFWLTKDEARDVFASSHGVLADLADEPGGDPYLAVILSGLDISAEAKACVDVLNTLLRVSAPDRDQYAADHPDLYASSWDAGIYQLKALWQERHAKHWDGLQSAQEKLSERLRPGVIDFGFLR